MNLQFMPPVIAHRGASGYAPENSLSAFVKAAQLGIKWVEFDVMQAACGEAVIFHDDLLDRTSNGKGPVIAQPYQVLEQLDSGQWFHQMYAGERILSLRQLLIFLYENKMHANIELKAAPGHDESLVDKVLDVIEGLRPKVPDTILFSSFSVHALKYLHTIAPNHLLGLLIHDFDFDWEKAAYQLNCVSLHVNQEIMTEVIAKQLKSTAKKLLCYTVNDPLRASILFSWGIDAVFSDVPDIIANSYFLK